ncbi:MAG TPA: TonB-dependent siderophore receptor [Hyphomicrobium sp.]|nr:TonB-dependent siderophore receptor [Hyphomicrobium sp.]
MSILRRRALPIGAATANSFFAFACLLHGAPAHGQETPKQPNALPEVQVEQRAKPPAKKNVVAKKSKPIQAPVSPPTTSVESRSVPLDPANALGTYNPALDLPNLELPPGTTITTAGPVDGYRALSAMSSTKTATPIEQIPQSIQVIPKSLIADQNNLTVTEAVENASNVQGPNSLGIANTDFANFFIRGFKAEQWLDGLVVNYGTGDRDAFANVERIEVLKGPAAILYGGGTGAPVGGAINIISKLPTDVAGGAFGITFGSDSYARPYFDVNQPLSADGTVLFRVTGEYTSADSFVDVLDQDRYSFNPTLTFTNKTDTTLTIQGRKSRYEQQAYPGLPVTGTVAGDFRIDRNLYIGDPNIPRSYSEVEGVTVTLDHRFDNVWSFNVKGRWSQSGFDQKSQGPISADFTGATPDYPPSTFSMVNIDLLQNQEEFTINPNLQARFSAGPTRNTLLFGVDYSHSTDRGHMYADFGVPPVDLLNPVFSTPYSDPNPASPFFVPFFDFQNAYDTTGVYGQIQTTVFDRIHLLGGLRWANLDVEYLEKTVAKTFTVDDSKVLPRAGIVVDLVEGFSVYTSYSEGMRWAGFSQALEVKPEFSEQREAGIKFNFANQLTGTMAVFDITRSNIPTAVGGFVAALTDQRSRGFETDLIWQPNRNWQVLANYGYVNAEVDSGPSAGVKLAQVPAHSGRVWVNYDFDPDILKGWSVGAGVYAASDQFVDFANVYKTQGYFTVDAKIGYENEKFAASFNVKNLTGEEYFVPYSWLGGQVAPGADRTYYGTLVYKY